MDADKLRRFFYHHSLPLILALIAIALALGGEGVTQALRYQQQAVADGQWWRLITGNFVHLGTPHLILNLAGLALIWGLLWDAYRPPAWTAVTLISSLGVTLGLWFFNPELIWYVGLSGMLHGMFVAGVVGGIKRGDRREAILLAAIVAKLIYEQTAGPMPGTAEMAEGPVVVDAHLYGAIAGAIVALVLKPRMWCE